MFNWLDMILLFILAITLVVGIIKGLVRQLVGILAVIIGLILGLAFYAQVGTAFRPLVATDSIAHFLGFLTIFFLVLLVGWLVSRLFAKVMKGPFKFINHLLGGGLGIIKGVLICGVLVFAMLLFPVNFKALRTSTLAPYCITLTKGVVALIPQELKDKFKATYQQISGEGKKDGERI